MEHLVALDETTYKRVMDYSAQSGLPVERIMHAAIHDWMVDDAGWGFIDLEQKKRDGRRQVRTANVITFPVAPMSV